MFRGHEETRRRGGGPFKAIFGIVRVFISLFIMAILLLGVLQAYKSFSGVDPLKTSPKSIIENIIASENLYTLITGLLSASPGDSLDKAKQLLSPEDSEGNPVETLLPDSNSDPRTGSPLAFRFAIVSDSHNDNDHLKKALQMAKSKGARFVVGLGDFTDVGTVDELRKAKLQFDTVGLPYYVTAGDHDLWDSRDKKQTASKNFQEVFGLPYQSLAYQNLRIVMMYDADNYLGIDGAQQKWLEDELTRLNSDSAKPIFVMTGTPLFHPSSDHQMGRINNSLRTQADKFSALFKDKGVKEVIAGDTHFFSRYADPKTDLKMTTSGAVTSTRNIQNPRFMMVEIYQDGSYSLIDTEIK